MRSSALKCVDERARQRAAVDRLQHRRLDLDEALVVEEAADRGDDLRARDEDLAGLLVGHQVELAVAQARLGVRQPVVLLRRRAQRLRQQLPVVDLDRQLAAAGLEDRAVGAEQVAEVERDERVERLLAEHVGPRVQLDPAGAVVEVEERRLALAAARGEAAGDAHARLGLLAGFESFMRRLGLGDRRHARVGVRERVDARLPQCLELAAAGGEELGWLARLHVYATSILVTVSSRCLPVGSVTLTASPFLRPTSALPTGDSLESRLADGIGLGRADDRVRERLALVVLDVDLRADAHDVGRQLRGVDHRRRAELVLERRDARLEHRLLVLGVVVLGVLRDVAELARFLDALGNLATLGRGEVLDLLLELLESLGGEDDVLLHAASVLLRG